MLSAEEELLAISTSNSLAQAIESDVLLQKADEQARATSSWPAKVRQFVRVLFKGNDFEQYVLETESNDCSLVAKYARTTDIDLSLVPGVLVDLVSLQTLHIPHPLVNFTKNEANGDLSDDVRSQLQEAPILVFLHGLGGQMSQFEPLMGLLSQCLEIVSLDLPGFGNSKILFEKAGKFVSEISDEDKRRISASVSRMAWLDFANENIVAIVHQFILQQIPEKKIVLIGHSMGTNLAIKVARKLPKHKVEGLILLSPPALEDDIHETKKSLTGLVSLLQVFSYLPFLFNLFRVWDRLEGLSSVSVLRQLTSSSNVYTRLRQFRWNLDINSTVVLRYAQGFRKAKFLELVDAVSRFNDNTADTYTYEKTLLIGGVEDHVTPFKTIEALHEFLTSTFGRKVLSCIKVNQAGHLLLLAKPEFISGMILNHIESKFPERLHLSPAWVLRLKADISGDKWGLKNELKWLKIQAVSHNITRRGNDISPLLGMKTLREGDPHHSPTVLESLFYGPHPTTSLTGKLIAIVDISADIPPYSPKSFQHIQYYKCATVSKVVPDQVAIRRFVQLIDDILLSNTEPQPLIAVHCHYGFNRTGFLICCYLIEKLGWLVHEAVDGFKQAKSPGIKHPHFIDALYVRYES